MKKIILLALLVITSCAPSEEVVQQAIAQTQAAYSPTPPPTSTPDLEKDYKREYLAILKAWNNQLSEVLLHNSRIANEGSSVLSNQKFIDSLFAALSGMDNNSKKLADLEPPTESTQPLQDKAEELHAESQTFTSSYKLAILGNELATDLAISSLENLTELYDEIYAMLE